MYYGMCNHHDELQEQSVLKFLHNSNPLCLVLRVEWRAWSFSR